MLKTVSNLGGTTGQLTYKGTWNASTNTPTLTSGVGTLNNYYIVSVAGSTNLDGITSWNVNDWAIFNGTVWEKISGQSGTVTSVTGTAPIVSSGGATPAISMPAANATTNGYLTSTDWSTFNSKGSGSVTSITAGTGLSGGTITTTGTIALANTTVVAATYGTASAVSQVTINAQGQVTSASNVTISIANTQVTGLGTMSTQNSNNVTITGGSINVQSTNLLSTTSSTATYGTASLPLQPLGFIQVDLNGTVVKVPYYAV